MIFRSILTRGLAGCMLLAAATGCNLMHDDLPPCATPPDVGVRVDFVYDYNMENVDRFDQEAGSVYLYVFDDRGVFLERRSAHRSDMAGAVDFGMSFSSTELEPGRTYQMIAIAESDPVGYNHTYVDSKTTPGFTLLNEMVPGVSRIDDYRLVLDRDNDGVNDWGLVDYTDAYGATETMIQTLWTTKPGEIQRVTVPVVETAPDSPVQLPDITVEVKVPMMRITNSIKVNLVNGSFDADSDPEAYRMLIYFPKGNGTVDFTGTTQPAQPLYYRAIWKKMVPYSPQGRADDRYALQGTFGVSRLQATDGSILEIRDPSTDELIDSIENFSSFLADCFEHGFDDSQEFLDREYDFEVEVEIDDSGKIMSVCVNVAILGWSKRVWRGDLR